MTLSSLEIIAIIMAIVAVIKILVILVNPRSWYNIAKSFWGNPTLTAIISAILAIVVLFFLLEELTIVQIFATMAFTALLATLSISVYSREAMGFAKKLLNNKKLLARAWFPTLIWLVLLIWVLAEIFA